jgi:hypothetical protein
LDLSELVKAALIVGVALLIAVGAWIYFSPYQTCLRANRYVEKIDPASIEDATDLGAEIKATLDTRRQDHEASAALKCADALGRR